MDVCTDVILELEEAQLIYDDEKPAASNINTVALCGPDPFVSKIESSLKNSSLPLKTVAFRKSDRETAEKISALMPATVLVDSRYATDGLMWVFQKSGLNVIKMDSGWKKTEEFLSENISKGRVEFINSLCFLAASCLVWEV